MASFSVLAWTGCAAGAAVLACGPPARRTPPQPFLRTVYPVTPTPIVTGNPIENSDSWGATRDMTPSSTLTNRMSARNGVAISSPSEGSVIGMGVYLGQSTPIINRSDAEAIQTTSQIPCPQIVQVPAQTGTSQVPTPSSDGRDS